LPWRDTAGGDSCRVGWGRGGPGNHTTGRRPPRASSAAVRQRPRTGCHGASHRGGLRGYRPARRGTVSPSKDSRTARTARQGQRSREGYSDAPERCLWSRLLSLGKRLDRPDDRKMVMGAALITNGTRAEGRPRSAVARVDLLLRGRSGVGRGSSKLARRRFSASIPSIFPPRVVEALRLAASGVAQPL